MKKELETRFDLTTNPAKLQKTLYVSKVFNRTPQEIFTFLLKNDMDINGLHEYAVDYENYIGDPALIVWHSWPIEVMKFFNQGIY